MIPRSVNKRPLRPIEISKYLEKSNNRRIDDEHSEITGFSSGSDCDDNDDYNNKNINRGENINTLNSEIEELTSVESKKSVINKTLTAKKSVYPHEYTYVGAETLETDLHGYLSKHPILNNPYVSKTVHICAYHVNTQGFLPYLQYFLYKEHKSLDFVFPSFSYTHTHYNTNTLSLFSRCISVLEVLCVSYYKDNKYVYRGYKADDNNIYVFFNCSIMNMESIVMDTYMCMWLVNMDEIVNTRRVCEFTVSDSVSTFFNKHKELMYLQKGAGAGAGAGAKEQEYYETPMVVYAPCLEKRLDFHNVFGIPTIDYFNYRSLCQYDEQEKQEEQEQQECIEDEKINMFGNYHYFTDFENALKNGTKMMGGGGFVRLAIFLGYCDTLTNQSFDTLVDRDGEWTYNYDSCIVEKCKENNMEPLYVTKNYKQQNVLSSHRSRHHSNLM